jgi:TetR/AcrR family transcriptional regulator, transcriptional repressor of aconitase
MTTELELRDVILEHARNEFLARGFSKVTVDEIASQLGISKKTLYKSYPSKEELLRASLHSMMRSAGWELERIVSSEKPLVEKLSSAMIMMGTYISKVPKESIVDLQRFAPTIWKELDKFRSEHIVSRLVAMIAKAKSENLLRPEVHEEVVVEILVNSIQGIVNPGVLATHSFSAEQAIRSIVTVIFQGALTEAARRDLPPTVRKQESP